ncbi:recombinase family protein [Allorhodopirellula heiligendammensis]|uniref:Recombinase n=1 Tax=Allorhodopirellula heiligendammensis TaxID=2714739 RepID=A0A5C6C261_9BACT|nr:recombinase family protein [Allorhodopirellula heiligendammensis]TWU18613.1 Recombinase [Allorhodopirellula heiligendammensis]
MTFGRIEVPPPKNGRRYRGIAVCRISTDKQNEMSLDDQAALYHERLPYFLEDPYDLEVMASQGSGELLDRVEFIELSEKIESGEYDFIVAEDLGRIARRVQVIGLCEAAEDTATRIIAINDHVDTLETESWRQPAYFAAMRHESYNRDTSNRIKRSHRNRFANGDMVRQLPAGYVKPHAGASEADCHKAPGAQEVYDECFDRLERGESFAEIATWFNAIKFPRGMSVRKTQWDGTLVGQTVRNPILKGIREHNRRTAVRVNRTGRRKSVAAAPTLLMQRECPRLAFIEPERFDRVNRMLNRRNEKFVKGIAKANGGRGRPQGTRNDARWPSQHVRCGICGRKFVLGGHGRKERMMCDGVRSYDCWNAMTVDQSELAQAVAARVLHEIESLPDFDTELNAQIHAEAEQWRVQQDSGLKKLHEESARLKLELDNFANVIAGGLASPTILARLTATEQELQSMSDAIADANKNAPKAIVIPKADEIRKFANETFLGLAVEDLEFGHIMREIVTDFFVLPYRLIDGGLISPRCVFTLNLAALRGVKLPDGLGTTSIPAMVDLTRSPQRVVFRERVCQLRAIGMTEREVATRLSITHTAAQRAAALDREMTRLGIADPWVPVRDDQAAADCYTRIRNHRYRFNPSPGFVCRFPNT